jgi:hypothetical protein
MVERLVDNRFESIWKEAFLGSSMYYPGSCLEGSRKSMNTLVRIGGLQAEIRTEYLSNSFAATLACSAPEDYVGFDLDQYTAFQTNAIQTQHESICFVWIFCPSPSLPYSSNLHILSLR